jgi:hypothetical protein
MLTGRKRERWRMLTPLELEVLPVFDHTEETKWLEEVLAKRWIRDPIHNIERARTNWNLSFRTI